MEQFDTPILFLIFNRPDLTKIVFQRIREIQPKYLFIAADGPRVTHPDDQNKCAQARKVVLDLIDWDCEVKTLFREQNLGCRKAVSQAITWFFENVEEGIILEDDCLPDLSFFGFCKELLKVYRDDDEIMHIGVTNWQLGKNGGESSYYFSNIPHVWGWATWRTTWQKFSFESLKTEDVSSVFADEKIKAFWINLSEKIKSEEIDSWAYYWAFSIWRAGGKCICPMFNLVKNIGFGENATHTNAEWKLYKSISLEEVRFPLVHPKKENINVDADNFTFHTFFKPEKKLKDRLFSYLYKHARKLKKNI